MKTYIQSFDKEAIKEDQEATEKIPYSEALRREKVAKAKSAELDLKQKEGSLVSKALVNEQLFNMGKDLREAILSIPNRVIDEILAASDNRTLALNILYDALSEELTKLAQAIQE